MSFDPAARAAAVRKACKGFGTDEDALIENLGDLSAEQAGEVAKAYAETINRDLVEDLKSELRGDLEDAFVTLVAPRGLVLASTIRKAVKGLGTDEKLLVEAVSLATEEELKDAAFHYRKSFEAIMRDEVRDDLGGKLKDVLCTIINTALDGAPDRNADNLEEDVLRLYKAGEGKIGTNTAVFVEVLCGNERGYVARVAAAYAAKYGKTLSKVIKSELSGNVETALMNRVAEPHVAYADLLYKAMKGMGSDEKTMIRIVVGQRHRMTEMNAYFLQKYEKSVERWVASEVGGDLKKLLVKIIQSNV